MSQKQQILAEIERLHALHRGNTGDANVRRTLRTLIHFINSLPEEEPSKVWHDGNELPDDTSDILLILKGGHSRVVDKDTMYLRDLVDKWAYIDELLKL